MLGPVGLRRAPAATGRQLANGRVAVTLGSSPRAALYSVTLYGVETFWTESVSAGWLAGRTSFDTADLAAAPGWQEQWGTIVGSVQLDQETLHTDRLGEELSRSWTDGFRKHLLIGDFVAIPD